MVFIRFILAKLTFEPQISFILEKAISRSPDSALLTIIGICTYNSAGTKAHVYAIIIENTFPKSSTSCNLIGFWQAGNL